MSWISDAVKFPLDPLDFEREAMRDARNYGDGYDPNEGRRPTRQELAEERGGW